MIDSRLMEGVIDAANADYVPDDFPKRLFEETSQRFKQRSERILFVRAVRNSDITVTIPDSQISDKDVSFVAYVSPERRSIESHMRQSWSSNIPVCERVRLDDTDDGIKKSDMAEAFAESLKQEIIAFDPIIGKLVEDGEVAVVIQYDLDYLMAMPSPTDVKTEEEYLKLSDDDKQEWSAIRFSGGRVSYRRYRKEYWRDSRGRRSNDRYYRDLQDDGTRKRFVKDPDQTRKAWKAHEKSISEGKVPLKIRLIPALDCAPLLERGTGNRRWKCRGVVIKSTFEESELISQGIWWNGAQGALTPIGFGDTRTNGRRVDFYEAHVDLEDEDGERAPCIVYSVDGRPTWCVDDNGDMQSAVINLKKVYGLTESPVNYFWGAHTEDDDPDMYGFPVMEPLAYTILNREGTRTAFQAHLRKYAFSKLAITPDPKIDAASYTAADGSLKGLDTDAEIIVLPGPVGPMVQPPPPTSVLALDGMYTQDLQTNSPSDPITGEGGSSASGHSLSVQKANFNSANSHVLEGARDLVEWTVTTALTMLGALEKTFGLRASVFPSAELPILGQQRKNKAVIEFNPDWFDGNYRIKAVYQNVGNLAEVQQTMDLYERGGASFEDLCDVRGKKSAMEERIKIMLDKWWNSPPGMQTLFIEVLKRRGSIEQAQLLEAQLNKEVQPGGMPTAAIPPELQAIAAQMGGGGAGAAGQPSLGSMPGAPGQSQGSVGGVQLPNLAASSLGGITSGAIGSGALMNDAMAQSQVPTPGG